MRLPCVRLKPKKARPFHGRHPWVLESAIDRVEGSPAAGEAVDLLSDAGQWIARGAWNAASKIRVRLYSWDKDAPLDEALWRRRLERAIELRRLCGYDDPSGACRLVFSESDGLSGLVVDRFADVLVVQVTAQAIAARAELFVRLLEELVRPRAMLIRWEKDAQRREGAADFPPRETGEFAQPTTHRPPDGPVFIQEHGVRYGVDLAEGQKTGFYLDQKENRLRAASLMGGRRVLDVCCYSGGFALTAALRGGAKEVLGIDSSQKAIALARANAELNEARNVRFDVADAFQVLQDAAAQSFGAVILDPPKFARRREATADALRAYHQLNQWAVRALEPGGILVTCSCSGYVTREDFHHLLAEVARTTGRNIQILETRGAAPDHPVSATCLESEYLKCLICRVE